jgi:hypothetical protein
MELVDSSARVRVGACIEPEAPVDVGKFSAGPGLGGLDVICGLMALGCSGARSS